MGAWRANAIYWPKAEEKFFEDLAHVIEYVKPLDLVLFTGDLTQRGTWEQFQSLDKATYEIMGQITHKWF
ncbi:MAG: metallophosphoesterase [Gammaproteobacteria bacterium]